MRELNPLPRVADCIEPLGPALALAVTMKLAKKGVIQKGSRVVIVSTAHGLKFVDFKLRFHQGQLQGGDTSLRNLPIEVSSNIDAVRAVIDGRLLS